MCERPKNERTQMAASRSKTVANSILGNCITATLHELNCYTQKIIMECYGGVKHLIPIWFQIHLTVVNNFVLLSVNAKKN